jgi:hypothetical protein
MELGRSYELFFLSFIEGVSNRCGGLIFTFFRPGLIDWKDFYFLMDAIVLLEQSGQFTVTDVKNMQVLT